MRSRILVGLLAGTIGGFLGFLLQEARVDYNEMARLAAQNLPVPAALEAESSHAITWFVGGMIGLFLGSVDGIVESNARKLWQGMLVGALGGVVMGSIGYYFGNLIYNAFGGESYGSVADPSLFTFVRQVVARSLGWAGLGVGLGVGVSLWTRSAKRIWHGAIGGFLGGFLGGFAFDMLAGVVHPVQQAVGAAGHYDGGGPSRAVGFTAIGAATGFFIGLVEELLKSAWVKVLAGRNEGKDFLLTKPMNLLGRDERCDVPLYGDLSVEAQHTAIRADGKRHVLLDAGTTTGTIVNGQRVAPNTELLLRDGDMIQIGTHRILFREKATANKFAHTPVDTPAVKLGGSASNVPVPAHICPFCGGAKKPDGSCLCTIGSGSPILSSGAAGLGTGTGGFAPAPDFGTGQGGYGANYGAAVPLASGMGTRAAGGASDMPRLVGVEGPYTGQVFLLTNPNMIIGREPDKDIVLSADVTVSRAHARIVNEGGDLAVYDNSSANGTFVNGRRISMQMLAPQDEVQFGASKFRYE